MRICTASALDRRVATTTYYKHTHMTHVHQSSKDDFKVSGLSSSDVNKDWTCKDKDQAYKDQDQDKDFTYSYLLQVAAKPTIAIKQQQ